MMLRSCEETCVTHIYREGNSLVDLFTNEAIRINDFKAWEEYSLLLEDAKILLRKDGYT